MPTGYGGSTTEERVVEMRIDNKQFEKGAKTTISTLEKLEKALNIKGKTDAIDDLANSVSRFDATPMADSFGTACDNISGKAAFIKRMIENVADDIYNFGKKTIKELTIDQVSAGMDKYTQLAESTQTIMAATQDSDLFIGKSEEERLKVINDYLDQLLWYSDETSYSFTDMTSNLGKFLAAGVELDDAVNAIMGVASWGASAGAKPAEVGRAMYNISQAMGAGSMKVVDWKSIENANMATLAFKENVLAIAADMGKIRVWDKDDLSEWRYGMEDAKKEADLFTAKSFREGLSEGWFDTDVMTEVFKRYGEFADRLFDVTQNTGLETNEALEILDAMRDVDSEVDWESLSDWTGVAVADLQTLFDALNNVEWAYSEQGFRMGQEYKTFADVIDYTKDAVSSGWMQTFKYIFGDFLEAKELWSYVGGLFDDIFVSSSRFRNEVLKIWHNIGGRDNLIASFENTVTAVSNIITPIKEFVASGILRALGYDFEGVQKPAEFLAEKLVYVTERFAAFTERIAALTSGEMSLREFIGSLGAITTPLMAVATAFGVLAAKSAAVKTALSVLNAAKFALTTLTSPLGIISLLVTGAIVAFKNWDKIVEVVKTHFTSWSSATEYIKSKLSSLKDILISFLPASVVEKLRSFKNTLSGIKTTISNFLSGSSLGIGIDPNANIFTKIISWIDQLKARIFAFKNGVKASDVSAAMSAFVGNGNVALTSKPTVLDKIIEGFEKVKSKIGEWKANAKSLGGFLGNIFSDLLGLISKVKFSDIWNSIKTSFTDFFSTIRASVAKLFRKSVDEGLTDMVTRSGMGLPKPTFKEWVSNLLPFASIKDWFLSLLPFSTEGLLENLPEINWEQVLMKVLNVGTILAGIKALRGLGKVENSFAKVLKNFAGVDFNKFLADLASPTSALADCIKVFTDENKGFPGLFSSIKKTLDSGKFRIEHKKVDSFGTTMLKLAVAIGILAGVVYLLSKMEVDDAKKSLTILGALAAGMLVFGGLAKLFKVDGKPIFMMAAALAILMIPLKLLANMSWNSILKGGAAIGILMAELSLFTRIAGKGIGKDSTVPFIKMALALLVLMIPLKQLAKMSWNEMARGLIGIAVLLGELSLAMKLSGNGITKGNTTPFLKLAVAVFILAIAVKKLSKLDTKDLIKGLGAVTILIFGLAASIRAMKGVGKVGGFLALAIAVGILAIVLKKLSKLSWGEIAKGAVGLGAIMLMMSVLMMSVRGMSFAQSISGLLLVVGTLAAFVLAFKYLENQNTNFDNMVKFAESVSMAILAISASMYIISKIKLPGAALGALGLDAIIVIVGGLVYGLGALRDYIQEVTGSDILDTIKSGAEIFAAVGLAIGDFIGSLLSGVWNATFGNFDLPQFGTNLSEFMTNVSAFVEGAKGVDSSVTTGALALADAIIAIVGAEFLNKIASIFGADLVGKFCTHITLIGMALKSYASSINGISDAEGDSAKALTIATGLNNLINEIDKEGGILSWISGHPDVSGFSEDIGLIADGLIGYATKIKGFSRLASMLDIAMASVAARGLADLDNALPKEGGALQKLIGSQNLSGFGEGIKSVAGGLVEYASAVSGIATDMSDADIETANRAANGLNELQKQLPETNGWLQKIVGWKDLAGFGDGVKAVGGGLKEYLEAITGIGSKDSEKDIKAAASAAKGLAELQNNLPETGGFIQDFFGEQSLADFGGQLMSLGLGLFKYAFSIKDIATQASDDDYKIAKTAAKGLSDLQSNLPNTGGILQDWLGSQSLSDFGSQLSTLGDGLWDYALAVKDISKAATDEDLARASSIATNLNALNNNLPTTGGLWQLITGEQDLALFATNIGTLGEALGSFATNINGVEDVNTGAAIGVLTEISGFVEELDRTGGFIDGVVKVFAGDKWGNLKDTVLNMGTFGRQFKAFSDGIKDASAADSDFAKATKIIQDFISLGSEYTDPDGQDMYMNAYNKALEVPQALANGLSENASVFYDALTTLIADAETYYVTLEDDGYTGGWNVAAGIANGISAGTFMAVSAMQVLVDSIMSGFSDPLIIASPSRAMAELAAFIPAGIAQGINQNGSEAINSVTLLGDNLLLAMQRTMLDVGMMADESFALQPTIAPVIDMTNARSAGEAIADLFTHVDTRSIFSATDVDGAEITRTIQGKDIVTEIRSINDHLSELDANIQGLQLVLDTGMLVGGIAQKMDNRLGIMSARKGRGN